LLSVAGAGVLCLLLWGLSLLLAWLKRLALLLPVGSTTVYTWELRLFSFSASGVAALLVFYSVYRYIPTAVVHWRAALVGALIGSLLWDLSQYAFIFLFGRLIDPSLTYGRLAGAVVFVSWVYLSTSILLVGLYAARLYEERRYQGLARE